MAVKIFGRTVSTPAAAAIAGGSGLAIWFAYKQHKASASATSTDPNAIDPVTGLPYSQDQQIDPLTGEAYLTEAQQYGSVAAAEQAVAGESSLDLTSAGGGGGLVGSSTGVTTEVASGGYVSNAAWAQAVTAGLTTIGYTSTDISAALGMYLGGLPLTTLPDGASSASIVEAALAEYGPPPVGSFTVIMAPSSGSTPTGSGPTGSGTSGGGTTSPGPSPTPTPAPAPAAPKPVTVAPSGFRVVSVTGHDTVNLAWNRLTPPAGQGPVTGYVIAYGPTSGSQQYKQYASAGDTAASVAGVGGGSAGKHYFELWATPANTGGPHAGPVEATTTKS